MAMPKGAKIRGGYATTSDDPDSLNFRSISEKLSAQGIQMNHASARNYLLRAMKKFAVAFSNHYDCNIPDSKLTEIAKSPDFQNTVRTLVQNEYIHQKNES